MEKYTENEQEEANPNMQKSGVIFGFWISIIIAAAALCAGGFCYVKMQQQQLQIESLAQKTTNIQNISNKQNNLEQRILNLENSSLNSASVLPVDNSAMLDEVRQNFKQWLAEKENALSNALQKLQNAKISEKPQMPEVLLASGALTVQNISQSGLPFEYEAEVLQILAQGNPQAEAYAAKIKQFAQNGVTNAQTLVEDFNNIYAVLNDMPTVELQPQTQTDEPEPQNWYEKTWQWIKKFAVHHKKMPKPEFAADKDTVYKLVNEGRFAEALNKMKTDVKYNSVAAPMLQEWQKQTEAYVDFDNAVQALIMNSLANIRLKEMQR